MIDREKAGRLVLESAMRVHSGLGAGLLESAYEACMAYELSRKGLQVERQVAIPVRYEALAIDCG